ncbi:histidine phosphatase family protein [Nisaea acidiphila]|uniref:Histidine phosphatase family protein n=1 Tax=Nisaea acidiphila TaxID=1862145 RepID=A0A9J7AWD8_9PROT|nr:histidine phosphatase family protein [Nisaea acidiphila]UUX51616.1 histidine phosphatase family protein [Nisaea acidiphila]
MRIPFASFWLLLFLAGNAAEANESGWSLLEGPRTVAIMRHAIAPGGGDPEGFRLGDCSTQRNLDARGREQARRIGESVRASGVRIDRVLSSQWCRCLETAELLGLGTVEELPALNSFFEDRSSGPGQTAATRAFLRGVPENETLFLVTHQVNITALTDVIPSSGEVLLLRVGADGVTSVLERILVQP